MNVRMFRVLTPADAALLQTGLAAHQVDTSTSTRGHQLYVAVWSDRSDLVELVHSVDPMAIPVNLDHVPLPRRGETHLVA